MDLLVKTRQIRELSQTNKKLFKVAELLLD